MQKIKNCLIVGSYTFPYGIAASARIRNLAYGFRDNGYTVYILAISPPFGAKGKTEWHEFDDNIFVRYLQENVPEKTWKNPTKRSMFFLRNLISSSKFIGELCHRKPLDFAFIYGRGYLSLKGILKECKKNNIFSILDITELPATYSSLLDLCLHPLRLDSLVGEKMLVGKANMLTCISTKLSSRYNNKLKYILPSVEAWEDVVFVSTTKKEVFTFLYVGSFMEKDNPTLLLKFFSELLEAEISFRLKVIGKYEYLKEGISWKNTFRSKFKNQVKFLGEASDSVLRQEMNSADALLLLRNTSTLEEYTFPTRLVEFLKSGRMVVTSPTGDIINYLTHLNNAFFIEYDKVTHAVKEIRNLISNRQIVTEIGKKGLVVGKKHMNRHVHTSAIISMYEEQSQLW